MSRAAATTADGFVSTAARLLTERLNGRRKVHKTVHVKAEFVARASV
ncbi:hypothetical protein ACIHFC_24225 [Streptomyces sp. NPDC052013]